MPSAPFRVGRRRTVDFTLGLMLQSTAPAIRAALIGVVAVFAPLANVAAQADDTSRVRRGGVGRTSSLDSLVARAVVANPAIHAAAARVAAARARVAPSGLLPDPMLMVGIQNLPLGKMQSTAAADGQPAGSGPDPMTMKMVGLGQTVPYPGKLAARKRVAEREVEAAEAALAAATRQVIQDVRRAYYELAFLDRALDVVERSQRVLGDFITVAEARYSVGTTGQQDVLKARVEATRLAETAVMLTEQRRAALARLNALLDRPSTTPVADPQVPERVARAAVAASAEQIRFVSAALGARAAESPLRPLGELQETAVRESPVLREQAAMIAAQEARVDLARREYLPDFDVSLQYGQRTGLPDMVTAMVSIPLPIYKRRKQDAYVTEARADLAALWGEYRARANEVRAETARLYSELERQRAQLALYVKAIIPQGRASLASATASYQVGRVEFLTVLENQATLFTYETEYFRALSDFATTLAELERVVGKEILP
jgi:cobalt-zinc-cadmium efflux system outer membrane protein